ncbi:MAG: SUF system Fe-S cluster assembly regulator [Gammaproteobacteria bacterium]|nr:SUF system Fe-S cluster assembly regulator [Gammaproteobacteria bacterium]
MLKINRLTDYALVVLCSLAKRQGAILSSAEISALVSLKAPTVSKILKILVKAGLVKSFRGIDGGYCLNKNASLIFLSDVIRCFEGPVRMTNCGDSISIQAKCEYVNSCQISSPWVKINQAIDAILEKVSIQDMAYNQVVL